MLRPQIHTDILGCQLILRLSRRAVLPIVLRVKGRDHSTVGVKYTALIYADDIGLIGRPDLDDIPVFHDGGLFDPIGAAVQNFDIGVVIFGRLSFVIDGRHDLHIELQCRTIFTVVNRRGADAHGSQRCFLPSVSVHRRIRTV